MSPSLLYHILLPFKTTDVFTLFRGWSASKHYSWALVPSLFDACLWIYALEFRHIICFPVCPWETRFKVDIFWYSSLWLWWTEYNTNYKMIRNWREPTLLISLFFTYIDYKVRVVLANHLLLISFLFQEKDDVRYLVILRLPYPSPTTHSLHVTYFFISYISPRINVNATKCFPDCQVVGCKRPRHCINYKPLSFFSDPCQTM